MDATVGDTEFWLLAKRVVAGGGAVASGDTVFSLQAKLTNLMGSGGTDGGGGGTDPGAVQKTGDTMTGPLKITSADGSAILDWEDTGGPFSIKFDTSAAGWPTIHMLAQGADISIVADVAGNLKLLAANIALGNTGETLSFGDPGGWIKLAKAGNQDLVVTSSGWAGTVNLTNGGVAPGGGGGVQKTGDTMTGPLAIATATQPELHLADAASGPQTFNLNNNGLKVADSGVGNSVEIGLAFVNVYGSGAGLGGSANKTVIGVNAINLGHKSYNQGNSQLSLYQDNKGDLWVVFAGGQQVRLTDFTNLRLGSPAASLFMISPDALSTTTLTLINGGDLVATATAGPNAGKSVNLTAGKWA